MPNPVFTYMLNISFVITFYICIKCMICKHILLKHTVKCSNSSLSNNSIYHVIFFTQFKCQTPIDRTLTGATTPGQSGPRNDANERILCILQSSSINGVSPSDCLISYPRHSFWVLIHPQRHSQCILQPQSTRLGLVCLFNGISTFVGYLMLKTSS